MSEDKNKVTITIEMTATGNVRVVSVPSFETMAKMELSGEGCSSANAYALAAINRIQELSREADRNNTGLIYTLPRIGRQ